MNDILSLIAKLSELYELKYNLIEPQIYNIINQRITDEKEIEHLLDELLSIPTDKSYGLLKILYKYYSKINKENVDFYLESYKELYLTMDDK